MDACQVYLLGSPHLVYRGQPVTIARRKQWGLLSYLLLSRCPHGRDILAALFWPAYDQRHAHADLRRELARLRSALPDLVACTHAEVAARMAPDLWVDVWAFEQHCAAVQAHAHAPDEYCAACLEHLRSARDLYAGDLLAGCNFGGSPDFEEWLFFQQESLRSQLLAALSRLAALEIARSDLLQAIPPLRQRLAIDPLHEESHRTLMWLYIHTGQRSAAVRQFDKCQEILTAELGTQPAPETIALYRQLMALAPVAPAPVAPAPVSTQNAVMGSPVSSEQPPAFPGTCFVGRERQLAQLHAQLDAACAGSGRMLFVTGEAGTGKTALLQHFACQAMARHSAVVAAASSGAAPCGADAPLYPFRDLLAVLAGDLAPQGSGWDLGGEQQARLRTFFPHVLHAVLTLAPHLVDTLLPSERLLALADAVFLEQTEDYARLRTLAGSHPGGVAPPEAHQFVFAEAADLLQALAHQRPLLLLFDNLHWADAPSLKLLFFLGKRLGSQPILIVGAWRPDEIALDDHTHTNGANQPPHPLLALSHELTRDFAAAPVDLDTAALEEDLAFVSALLAAESCRISPALHHALCAQAAGQPLFTLELLQLWRTRGWLQQDADGFWVERQTPDLAEVPARAAAALQCRLDRLSDDGVRLLAAASVAVAGSNGQTFTASALAATLGWSERRALEILAAELHHRHHIVVEAAAGTGSLPGSYRFATPLLRTWIYGQLDSGERCLLHTALSQAGSGGHQSEQPTPIAAQVGTSLGTRPGTIVGRVQPILERGMVDGQDTLTLRFEPVGPLAEIAHSQRSASMYHRWHLNYPVLILLLALLLLLWVVTYTIATTPNFNISDLWQRSQPAEMAAGALMIEVAPGYYVPQGYWLQEKGYREATVPQVIIVSPGYQVPADYWRQEKTYREPTAAAVTAAMPAAMVEVAPGFKVPQDYWLQEKTYREPAMVEISPGFKVPQDYWLQEKTRQ